MIIEPLFDFSNDKKYNYNWVQQKPKDFGGLILPGMQLIGLTGVFGNMLFQSSFYTRFSIWYNQYAIKRRMKTHARLDGAIVEMSLFLETDLFYALKPFDKVRGRPWQFNVIYDTHMDNKVQFDSGTKATTLDIHFGLELLEMLFECFPDLVGPLLESIHAGKPILYFPEYLYASPEMVNIIDRILPLLNSVTSNEGLMEYLVCLLLLEALAIKSGKAYCHMRYDDTLKIRRLLDQGVNLALTELSTFKGNDYYAAKCLMSCTTFKKYMLIVKGRTLRDIWQDARLDEALEKILHTDTPIANIAVDFGYASYRHLRELIISRFGLSPAALRSLM